MSQKLYREGKDYTQEDLRKIRVALQKTAPLTTFKFEKFSPGEQWISISSPEFTAICPFSDFPDFGTVTIRYIPDKRCLELKSFKLYINAFRNVKIFHEAVTEVIFADFLESVKPKKAHIVIDMNVRGNVKTICEKKFRC
ncbi:preQ(1) synthase [Patescibacteria group bacterium]|nr:preQ(1) synthase [Patescibacteria group bacterium]MBU1015769.1 preQ(1) synthase [Patescibacteria group bacterium]MBU1685177.1 preQ(1) synthase [Patescibacteria group bacterium]MBU1938313.1 preQ(1) synthase [Patescibacteria group bacterium]